MHIGIGDSYIVPHATTAAAFNHITPLATMRSFGVDARDSDYTYVLSTIPRVYVEKKTILQVTPKLDTVRGNNKINCTSRQQQRHTTLHRVVSSNFFSTK